LDVAAIEADVVADIYHRRGVERGQEDRLGASPGVGPGADADPAGPSHMEVAVADETGPYLPAPSPAGGQQQSHQPADEADPEADRRRELG
jgi:hypothetical protein